MQWHKRDSCTHSFWHQVIYTYCTSLLPYPSNILYRARYKTGLEFENIMQWSAGVWTFNVCNIFTPSSLLLIRQNLLVFISGFHLHAFCFESLLLRSLLVLLFCVTHLMLHTFSLSFLHAALCHAAPSQGLVTFFLQVTKMFKGETLLDCC